MDAQLLIKRLPILSAKLPEIEREMGARNYDQAEFLLNGALLNMGYHGLRQSYSDLLHNGPSLVASIGVLEDKIEKRNSEEITHDFDMLKLFLAQATLPDGSASGRLDVD